MSLANKRRNNFCLVERCPSASADCFSASKEVKGLLTNPPAQQSPLQPDLYTIGSNTSHFAHCRGERRMLVASQPWLEAHFFPDSAIRDSEEGWPEELGSRTDTRAGEDG